MKIKSFSELGELYSQISNNAPETPAMVTETTEQVPSDVSHYLPESKMVKPGSAMGGGPGTKGDVSPLQKKTGPEGLKGNNFEKVTEKNDKGADKKAMKKEEEGKEECEVKKDCRSEEAGSEAETDAAKVTTPEEKVNETAQENNKYNYKPKFTMSKSKFDQLYENALKRVPFTEEADAALDAGVPPADDMAADADLDVAEPAPEETEEVVSHEEAVELCRKLLKFLEKDIEHDIETDTLGGEDLGAEGEHTPEEHEAPAIAEKVEAEDEGTPLENMKKGKPDAVSKPVSVGDLKKSSGTADKGKLRNEPEPKEEKGDDKALQSTKKFTTGSGTVVKPGAKLFD